MSIAQNSNLYSASAGTASTAIFALNPIVAERDPSTTDIKGRNGSYPIGQIWVNQTDNTVFALSSFSAAAGSITANWTSLQGAASGVDDLDGDTGTATPSSGTITIAGTANQVTTAGAGSTITLSVPSDFRVAGTITALSGNITATNGNIVRGSAGNKDIYGSIASSETAGDDAAGECLLTNGVATIATTAITANSQVRLSRVTVGASGSNPIGELAVINKTPGSSFDVVSLDPANAASTVTTDQSAIFWEIVN